MKFPNSSRRNSCQ